MLIHADLISEHLRNLRAKKSCNRYKVASIKNDVSVERTAFCKSNPTSQKLS